MGQSEDQDYANGAQVQMLKTNMKTNNIGIEQDVVVSIYCMQMPFFVEKN